MVHQVQLVLMVPTVIKVIMVLHGLVEFQEHQVQLVQMVLLEIVGLMEIQDGVVQQVLMVLQV